MLRRMGYPRCQLVPPDAPGIYHCGSRCVRRAFLCGEDPVSGQSFEHRKQWIESRILSLAELFAVAVHAYAVMSNHFHVVLEVDPGVPATWSNTEVARRWLTLSKSTFGEPLESRVAALAAQSKRLDVLRKRLGSLSWYMRYLKEPIARWANAEDGCTGRFWEGRFESKGLLDEQGLLSCMTYVDLNPVRAGIATTPEDSLHTSVRRRVLNPGTLDAALTPLASSLPVRSLPVTGAEYLELVDWTGRMLHPDKRGAISRDAPPILARLSMRSRQWLVQVPATESQYRRVIGTVESMRAHARNCGLGWLRGIGVARAVARAGRAG